MLINEFIFRSSFFGEMESPADRVFSAALFKAKFHSCILRLADKITMHHIGPAFRPAGGSVQGKDDGVEDRGFSGAGIPRDQEQTSMEFPKIDGSGPCIGSESFQV